MAITATLKYATPNRLRFLIVASVGDGEDVDIAIEEYAERGPMKQLANALTTGYGKIAAGAELTQAIARALLQSDDAEAIVGEGVSTAMCHITGRSGGPLVADATIGADGATLSVNVAAPGAAASGYLDIEIPGAIGA